MAVDEARMAVDEARMAVDEARMAVGEARMAVGEARMAVDEARMAVDEARMAVDVNVACFFDVTTCSLVNRNLCSEEIYIIHHSVWYPVDDGRNILRNVGTYRLVCTQY
jgi:hypothetical protein